MKTFKDYISHRRTFVSVGVSETQQQELVDFKRIAGLENNKDFGGEYIDPMDFYHHITILYSSKGHADTTDERIESFELETDGWELLGRDKDCLTIRFKQDPKLISMKEKYESKGLISDWPTFKPHLTLVYNYKKTKVPRVKPPKSIIFDRLFIEETIDLSKYSNYY